MSHRDHHPVYDPTCFGCKAASISISATATPTRRPDTARKNFLDQRWSEDHDAYRRMRAQGLHPAGIDNAAQMERGARTRYEIEAGVCMPKTVPTRKLKALVNQGIDISLANNVAAPTGHED